MIDHRIQESGLISPLDRQIAVIESPQLGIEFDQRVTNLKFHPLVYAAHGYHTLAKFRCRKRFSGILQDRDDSLTNVNANAVGSSPPSPTKKL